MRSGSPELEAALEAGERRYTASVRLGGKDVTDQVDSWQIDRAYDGGLPEQVASPAGASAAEVKLTLSGGEGRAGGDTAAQLYSPWAPRETADVARPGQSAVVHWGVGGQDMQALRGRVRTVQADSRAGTAQVTCLDGAEAMRGDAWLPPFLAYQRLQTASYWSSVPWILDHAARECGFYSSPPARENSIFFASLNRGMTPNRGGIASTTGVNAFNADRSPWTAGPQAVPGQQWTANYIPQRRVLSQFVALLTDWWVKAGPDGAQATSEVQLEFGVGHLSGGTLSAASARWYPETWTVRSIIKGWFLEWTVPQQYRAAGPIKISWELTLQGTDDNMRARCWVTTPAGIWASPTHVSDQGGPGWGWLQRVIARSQDPMECLNVTRLVGSPPIVQQWRRNAEILPDGAGRNALNMGLDALPETSGSWWDLVKQITSDHQMYAAFDEDGVFRVHGRGFISPDDPPTEADLTVTSARELGQATATQEADQVANIIRAEPTIYPNEGQAEDWYRFPVTTIGAGSSAEFEAPGTDRAWGMFTPYPYIAEEETANIPRVKCYTPGGQIAPVEVELVYGPVLKVILHNRGSQTARVSTTFNGGTGSLVLARRQIQSERGVVAVAEDYQSIQKYGRRVLDIPASPWVQIRYQALIMARAILEWTREPIPLSGDLEILPDPRVQLGDVVRVIDPTGVMVDGMFRVLGVRTAGRGGEVTQTLTIRPVYRPAPPVDAGLTVEPITDPDAAPLIRG